MKAFETYLLDRAKKDGAHKLDEYKKLGGYKGLEKVLKGGMTPAAVNGKRAALVWNAGGRSELAFLDLPHRPPERRGRA